jgi:CheY-like chemotaxis protein
LANRKIGKASFLKAKKDSARKTFAVVTKEISKPRIAHVFHARLLKPPYEMSADVSVILKTPACAFRHQKRQKTRRSKERNRCTVNTSKSILTISRNATLQNIRTLVLQHAGYQVSAAINDKEAIDFVTSPNTLRLVLMCHSVPEASRVLLVNKIKALKPKLPIMMLYNGYDPTEAKVDGSLHSLETPEAMLDMIGFMTADIADKA